MTNSPSPKHLLRMAALQLIVASFVVLFQELALIRWLPSQVRVLAYFPNVVLIAAFLGLGVGCLRASKRSLLWLWPVSLMVLVGAAVAMSRVAFTQESVSEHLWLLYYDIPDAPVFRGVRLPIVICFILCALSFVALGQIVARQLRVFQENGAALWGYSFDLLGSLVGVIGFALASFARTFPIAWFGIFLLAGVYLVWRARSRLLYIACAIAVVAAVGLAEKAEQYSPYYAISVVNRPDRSGVQILTNGSLHQYAAVVNGTEPLKSRYDEILRVGYHVPYRLLQRPPRRVLVLGAGTGNDVATALAEGAEQVDAIEIDPVILGYGKTLHPLSPYASPRVRAISGDARQYLNTTEEKYDLIVFGTLDSMTRLSALSGVRLDNFVYTTDCLKAARQRLTPDGGVMMYFVVGSDYIHQRLVKMLFETFGDPPVGESKSYGMFNTVLVAGPAFAHVQTSERRDETELVRAELAAVEAPSDDWPFLYLRGRSISAFYLTLIGCFAAIALIAVYLAAPEMFRRRITAGARFDAEMFLFGAAFLLLETKFVTEMNLVWGVTWLTSAIVVGAVLATLLASTILMQLRPLPWWLSAAGLVVSLLVSYLVPTHVLLGHGRPMTLLLSVLFVGVPIFFASTCFALRFRERTSPDIAFGWNLLGTVAGGALEFCSMAIGFRALSLLALGLYVLAFALKPRDRQGRASSTRDALVTTASASRQP